jgi:hypothetical protein
MGSEQAYGLNVFIFFINLYWDCLELSILFNKICLLVSDLFNVSTKQGSSIKHNIPTPA